MDLTEPTCDIKRLTDEFVWSSNSCIPVSTGQWLDIGYSVMGDASSTPIGATDQPLKYPTGKNGSVYMLPTTYVGLESWPAYFGILK